MRTRLPLRLPMLTGVCQRLVSPLSTWPPPTARAPTLVAALAGKGRRPNGAWWTVAAATDGGAPSMVPAQSRLAAHTSHAAEGRWLVGDVDWRRMEATRLSGGTSGERAQAFATLVSAFRADPVERWLYPGDQEYETFFPGFLAAFGGEAFTQETVWRLDDFAAVALWLPPSAEPDADEIVRVLMTTVDRARHRDTMAALRRWTLSIRVIPIGTCHGSVSRRACKGPVSAVR